MKASDLRDLIDSLTQDIDFSYNGKNGSICPISRTDISLCYDGDAVDVQSVDAAMSTPFIDGHVLNDLCDKLDI